MTKGDKVILSLIGFLFFAAAIATAWFFREDLYGVLSVVEPYALGITAGILLLITILPLVEILMGRELRLAWRKRFEERESNPRPSILRRIIVNLQTFINNKLTPIYRKGPGRIFLGWWQDAGFGSQPFSLTLFLIGIICFGGQVGYLTTGSGLLSGFFTLLLLGGFLTLLYSRAKTHRQLFQDQFPGVLDRLADSLQAGFSLPQALEFFAPNLSEPSASEMTRICTQLQIGFSIEQALTSLYQRRPNEDVRLLVEGIKLQRQVGGNMIEMIREIGKLIRDRVDLENEIRTLTAQGRLSAIVIALLVPVSLGLLSFFPGYTDVLFKTTIGNLVLIAAGILELIGAIIVVRLIRIEV